MKHTDKLELGFALAQQINKEHGKSYYWATQLFPPEKRKATYALYAFFRLADDIVDAPDVLTRAGQSRAHRELEKFSKAWSSALNIGDSPNPVLHAAASVCHQYNIADSHSNRFLNAMAMDITQNRYMTSADLQTYMDGSAASVGLMMAHVLGVPDESALPHLANLGNAMQLTNFLRDVDEDYHSYRRIYIPLEDLDRFSLSENDIASRNFSPRWRNLMEFEAERSLALYADAEIGISMLDSNVRYPVRVASTLYSAILRKLREKDWNVFAGRAKTSTFEKIALTLQTATRA